MIRNKGVLALAMMATLVSAQPSGAQNSPSRRDDDVAQPGPQNGGAAPHKKHHSGLGAAIGAGVVGGLVGGALLNGQRQAPPPPGYAPGGYAPPPPPPPAYEADDDEPVCHLVRRPVYDEDGEIVDYRTRRVCR